MNAPDQLPTAVDTSEPLKQTPNALLERHGPTGRLILTLQRYALTGWIAFFALLVFFLLLVVISTFAPKPILAVDESGRVLGTFEYLDASNRTSQEILAGSMYFAQNYLSLNADSIFEDYAEAMSMMSKELYDKSLALVKDGYLVRIKSAGARSRVVFDRKASAILNRDELTADVRLRGHIEVKLDKETKEQPFDITIRTTAIPRSTLSTRGLRIDEIRDN